MFLPRRACNQPPPVGGLWAVGGGCMAVCGLLIRFKDFQGRWQDVAAGRIMRLC